jgi:hypothetical protein
VTKSALVGVLVTVMGLSFPALAQLRPERPAISRVDESLIGLPIFSSDGVRLGVVVEVGLDDDEEIAIGAFDQPLGIGSVTVAIPADLFVRSAGSIKLIITAIELRANLYGPQRK